MDAIARYEFDRQGFLHIPQMLAADEVAMLSAAMDRLEAHALEHVNLPPRRISLWGNDVHHNLEKGYYAHGSGGDGNTLIVEDFFNTDAAFDFLVNHAKTMDHIRDIVQGPVRINNSELRVRYSGNATGCHMGGPIDHKYRYSFNQRGIDCMMVRIIYFIQDVSNEQGAFSVVPGTHKTNYNSPYRCGPDEEPGMVGIPVKWGDAILFTENLRHGGLTNHSKQVRKTLHVGYGPVWMMSQNMATMDEQQNITEETLVRYNADQRKLFVLGRQEGH